MRPVAYQKDRRKRALRFLVGGGFATLVHWLVMFLLIDRGVDARLATATGATLGLVVNYLAQYHYTFRSRLPHRVAFSRYLASSGLGWTVNLGSFSAMYALTGVPMASQAVATAAATFANHLLAEKFVFPEEEPTHDTR